MACTSASSPPGPSGAIDARGRSGQGGREHQRDVNIALVNELALIFDRLGIDTQDVLDAAGSKWNFLPFRPGLVGGHCIGVDPYYLLHKSEAWATTPT